MLLRKVAPKVQTFRLVIAHIKNQQISHITFGSKSQFFFKFCTPFRHNSSVLFHIILYMPSTEEAHQSANFQTFDCSDEN